MPDITPTSYKWPGALSFPVSSAGVGATWAANMRAADPCTINFGGSLSTLITATNHIGNVYVALNLTGNNAAPVTQVTSGNLDTIDQLLQARNGPVQEWLLYSDDVFTGTVPQKIAQLQSNVDTIHNYVRGSSGNGTVAAPAFKALYFPGGTFLNTNLPTNSILATYPDGVCLQGEYFQDQPTGADPALLVPTISTLTLLHSLAPNGTIMYQLWTYSKSNTSNVWSSAKVLQDINAVGYNCPYITFFSIATLNTAPAQAVFNTVLANYRP